MPLPDENTGLLGTALAAAVPLRWLEFAQCGGIEPWEFGSARLFGQTLAEKGDILLFRSTKQGETARVFNGISKALAILAFQPGGVKVFGQHFDAHQFLTTWIGGDDGAERVAAWYRASLQRYHDALVTEIPAYCQIPPHDEQFGPWNVIHWFENAHQEQLRALRGQGYTNTQSGEEHQVATLVLQEILKQARQVILRYKHTQPDDAEAERQLTQACQLLQAHEEQRPLLCFIERAPAERWLEIFFHDMMTAEAAPGRASRHVPNTKGTKR